MTGADQLIYQLLRSGVVKVIIETPYAIMEMPRKGDSYLSHNRIIKVVDRAAMEKQQPTIVITSRDTFCSSVSWFRNKIIYYVYAFILCI